MSLQWYSLGIMSGSRMRSIVYLLNHRIYAKLSRHVHTENNMDDEQMVL